MAKDRRFVEPRFVYGDADRGVSMDDQTKVDDRNRTATRNFEAHFRAVAKRHGAPVFDYRREERVDG